MTFHDFFDKITPNVSEHLIYSTFEEDWGLVSSKFCSICRILTIYLVYRHNAFIELGSLFLKISARMKSCSDFFRQKEFSGFK